MRTRTNPDRSGAGPIRWARLLAATVAVASMILGLGACDAGSAQKGADIVKSALAVPADQLATKISSELSSHDVRVDPGSMSCPQPLAALDGQSLECTFTSAQQPVAAVIKVTTLKGASVGFDISTKALPIPKAELATAVKQRLGAQLDVPVDSVSCAADLPAQPLGKTTCQVTSGAEKGTFVVRTGAITGGLVTFVIDSH